MKTSVLGMVLAVGAHALGVPGGGAGCVGEVGGNPAGAGAQPVATQTQSWIGVIEVPGRRAVQQIPIVVSLERTPGVTPGSDEWGGTFDISPGPSTPGLRGVPLSGVEVSATRLHFVTPSQNGDAAYELGVTPDGARADGRLTAQGGTMSVHLRRVSAEVARDAVIRRPQEPRAPSGYRASEIFIASPADGTLIYGELTVPDGATTGAPVPGVVLIGDLGATDRDQSGAYHRPFLVLADALSRAGFAVIRLDDRGIGQSLGDERLATPEVSAADAAGALAALASAPGVDPARLGYLGLGEGAVTAAIAAQSPLVPAPDNPGGQPPPPANASFIVMLSPRGVPLLDSELDAAQLALEREGETGAYGAARIAARKRALEAASAYTTPYDAVGEPTGPLADALHDELAAYETFGRGDMAPTQESSGLRAEMADMTTPSRVSRYRHDPAPVYEKLAVPVLVLSGGEDMVNPARVNTPAVVAALKKSPGAKVTSEVLPGLNQMLQPCVTGLQAERLSIETTIDRGALAKIVDWIRERAQGVAK
jgi:pimeloyl-ACP methyl ester carboxylesterase